MGISCSTAASVSAERKRPASLLPYSICTRAALLSRTSINAINEFDSWIDAEWPSTSTGSAAALDLADTESAAQIMSDRTSKPPAALIIRRSTAPPLPDRFRLVRALSHAPSRRLNCPTRQRRPASA